MALPIPLKGWQFNLGVSLGVGSYRTIFRSIITQLTSFAILPWVVKGSSNGATAGMDGVNRWAANSDMVGANGDVTNTVPRSWIVLRNPTTGAEILVHLNGNGAEGNQYQFYHSGAAGFTGGSTTSRPTAADQLAASNTGDGSWYWQYGTSGTNNIGHFLHSTDGRETRVVMVAAGWGYSGTWMMGQLAGSDLPVPNFFMMDTFLGITSSLINNWSDYRGVCMHTPSGGRYAKAGFEASFGNFSATEQAFPNDLNNAWAMGPIYLSTAAAPWVKGGRIIDTWVGSGSVVLGSAYPLNPAPTRQFAQFGRVIVPWNGTIPLVS